MEKRFYSNGKLLITGEYVVLDGADAFALPTKFGQDLVVEENNENCIKWTSFDSDGSIWFEQEFSTDTVINRDKFDLPVTDTLIEILYQADQLNPSFLKSKSGFDVKTHLSFPRKWGLGTSSTLINNIAQWFRIDPYVLLQNSFGGSGYDIACAKSRSAVIYNMNHGKPVSKEFVFTPEFHQNIYFVYLNQKQNSRNAIASYRAKTSNKEILVCEIDVITKMIVNTPNIEIFSESLERHEQLLSVALEFPTVKEALFSDFPGTVKSLGAWGGDFVLVVSDENPETYFRQKGYDTIIKYQDMIL